MKEKEVTKTAPMIVVTNEKGEALPHNQNFARRDSLAGPFIADQDLASLALPTLTEWMEEKAVTKTAPKFAVKNEKRDRLGQLDRIDANFAKIGQKVHRDSELPNVTEFKFKKDFKMFNRDSDLPNVTEFKFKKDFKMIKTTSQDFVISMNFVFYLLIMYFFLAFSLLMWLRFAI